MTFCNGCSGRAESDVAPQWGKWCSESEGETPEESRECEGLESS